jgi:signal transduction histidine kinase
MVLMGDLSNKQQISHYIIQSQEEEIKRIALELHEGVGQTLYSLFTGMQFIESSLEQPAVKQFAKEMESVLEKTIQEVRLLAVELYPPTMDTLGFVSAMKSYLMLYTSTFGIVVIVNSKGNELPLTKLQNITLFRVCQEALTNIAKYADTSEATMNVIWDLDGIQINIQDKGKGFDLEQYGESSSGLAAMKERMILVGGTCSISSKEGQGTTVQLQLSLKQL